MSQTDGEINHVLRSEKSNCENVGSCYCYYNERKKDILVCIITQGTKVNVVTFIVQTDDSLN